mgnify:CR=1 FL=1
MKMLCSWKTHKKAHARSYLLIMMGEMGSTRLQPWSFPIGLSLIPFIESHILGMPLLKKMMRCEGAVREFLESQGTGFYKNGFFKLITRYNKCLNVNGDYVENRARCIVHVVIVYFCLEIMFPCGGKKMIKLTFRTSLIYVTINIQYTIRSLSQTENWNI